MKIKRLYYDFEIYPNYWLVVFKDQEGKKISISSRDEDISRLGKLRDRADDFIFIGFNNNRYDTVMLNYILEYFDKKTREGQELDMYAMSYEIVEGNGYWKKIMADYRVPLRTYEMDVSNFLLQGTSAKEMACRLHHPILETLPFDPHDEIAEEDIPHLEKYCENDVDIVIAIAEQIVSSKLEVVLDVIDYWNLDKSLMRSTLSGIVELALVDQSMKASTPTSWRYIPPVNFNFKLQEFRDVEETYRGLILTPNYKFHLSFPVGDMEISFAMGGAHGAVKKSYFENLIDIDVDQFYPIMLYSYDLLPNTIKDKELYGKLIEDKKRYGLEGNPKVKAVKESINAIFGRTGFESSKLYSPDKLYATTITGQLLQLRLIEDLTIMGYSVVYVNTDGITILDNGDDTYKQVVSDWANEFGVEYKTVDFKRAYYRDVNNFIAEDKEGNLKRKGDLAVDTNKKTSCFGRIATEAVVEHLIHGTDIREYINKADDLRDFLMYHKYNRDMSVYLQEGDKLTDLTNVVRYVIMENKENAIVHKKSDKTTLENRKYNKSVMLVPTFTVVDGKVPLIDGIDKEAYVKMAFDILSKVTGDEVEDNPYIEEILERLGVSL